MIQILKTCTCNKTHRGATLPCFTNDGTRQYMGITTPVKLASVSH